MATTTIKWNEGEGNIVATYTGSGNAPVSVTSEPNEGIDREQEITIQTTKGNNPKSISVIVRQEGLREEYITADDEVYMTADGEIYGVLKSYTEVKYLEGSGSQYINLGIVFKNTDECYAEAAMLTSVTDKFFIAPTNWNDKGKNRFSLGGCYSNSFGIGYGGNTTGTTRFTPTIAIDTNKHTFHYKDELFTMVDTGATRDVSSITWNGDTTELRLFYGYNAPCACRIYSYKQWRDGELIIDLIPVVDNDGVGCMYDKVNGAFLRNCGTGDFIVGK